MSTVQATTNKQQVGRRGVYIPPSRFPSNLGLIGCRAVTKKGGGRVAQQVGGAAYSGMYGLGRVRLEWAPLVMNSKGAPC